MLSGCAYRFTNQNIELPVGVRTLAVEAIYDTSSQVIPHELLWEELQRAFAADGHYRLVSQGRADAILRAHIKTASFRSTGSTDNPESSIKDPKRFNGQQPEEFKTLTRAGETKPNTTLGFTVNVEIINLHTRKRIFEKSYSKSGEFKSLRDKTVVQARTKFLFHEEALRYRFQSVSRELASEVVRDFVVGR